MILLTDKITSIISSTWETPYASVCPHTLGHSIRKKFASYELDYINNLGLKGNLYLSAKKLKEAATESIINNLNHIAITTPYKISALISMRHLHDESVLEITDKLTQECQIRNIALTNVNLAPSGIGNEYLDITIISSAIHNKKNIINKFVNDDVVVGFKSTGLHNIQLDSLYNTLRNLSGLTSEKTKNSYCTEQSASYGEIVRDLVDKFEIHAAMCVDGWESVLPYIQNSAVIVDLNELKPPDVFKYISGRINPELVCRKLNCGIGYVISCTENVAERILNTYPNFAVIIGNVELGKGQLFLNYGKRFILDAPNLENTSNQEVDSYTILT